ncbi:MAG: Holliday junction resolvase RecU [Mycoplasma sp.]
MLQNGKKIEKMFIKFKNNGFKTLALFRVRDYYESNKNHENFSNEISCDFIGVMNGIFIAIELKSTSNPIGFNKYKISKNQHSFLRKTVESNGLSCVFIYFENEDVLFYTNYNFFKDFKVPQKLNFEYCSNNFKQINNVSTNPTTTWELERVIKKEVVKLIWNFLNVIFVNCFHTI